MRTDNLVSQKNGMWQDSSGIADEKTQETEKRVIRVNPRKSLAALEFSFGVKCGHDSPRPSRHTGLPGLQETDGVTDE
jgi:hypothetical protein